MDKEFQTTFIPKQPIAKEEKKEGGSKSRPMSLFNLLATIVLIAALLSAGGVYLWEISLVKRIETQKTTLERSEKEFEPALLAELQGLDRRLILGERILSRHIMVSPIFRLLEEFTLPEIRYSRLAYQFKDGIVNISLEGEAHSSLAYTAIALQSRIFGENPSIRDHIFSDFRTNQSGNVLFKLALSVEPSLVLFEEHEKNKNEAMLTVPLVVPIAPPAETEMPIIQPTSPVALPEGAFVEPPPLPSVTLPQ